jgi:hypothetical protein
MLDPQKNAGPDAPINPNNPIMEPNTSTINIRTKRLESAASAMAAFEPVIPTEIPQRRLHIPTVRPPQNSAKPDRCALDQEKIRDSA